MILLDTTYQITFLKTEGNFSFPRKDNCTHCYSSTEVPSNICSVYPILFLSFRKERTVYNLNIPNTVHLCVSPHVPLLPHLTSVENQNPVHLSKAIPNATSFSRLCNQTSFLRIHHSILPYVIVTLCFCICYSSQDGLSHTVSR